MGEEDLISLYQKVLKRLKSDPPEIREIRDRVLVCCPDDKFALSQVVRSRFIPGHLCAPNEIKRFWDVEVLANPDLKHGKWILWILKYSAVRSKE